MIKCHLFKKNQQSQIISKYLGEKKRAPAVPSLFEEIKNVYKGQMVYF